MFFLAAAALDLATLLEAYTVQGAYQLNLEARTGSIEVGKAADLIVVDRNLFEIPVEEISETEVLLTVRADTSARSDGAGSPRSGRT